MSDAGGPLGAEAVKSLAWRIKRYQAFHEVQPRAVRGRLLFTGLTQKEGAMRGAYFHVGGSVEKYTGAVSRGYSKSFSKDVIANVRTDMGAFSDVERGVLENHGYALMDAAVRTHVPELLATDAPFASPSPAFAGPETMARDCAQR